MTADETISVAKLASKVDRLEESLKNHCEYTAKATEAETKRINDIHEVDAKALILANSEVAERAAALASNVEKVASNVRDLVETTRSALSKSLSELINPIVDRLSAIEKKQYETQGKEYYSDPLIAKLVETMATETKRINGIHEEDAKALNLANKEASDKATALASNVENVASNVRDLVETTRSANAKMQSELINPIVNRLNQLEQKQYENKGKEFYSDPMMTKVVEKLETVASAMSENKGKGAGATAMWGYIVGVIGVISAIVAIVSRFAG